jgi:hypothetical protein
MDYKYTVRPCWSLLGTGDTIYIIDYEQIIKGRKKRTRIIKRTRSQKVPQTSPSMLNRCKNILGIVTPIALTVIAYHMIK